MCQRRIVKGTRTHAQKRYMVYLVKARETNEAYDNWLCGGALVTTSQILTSAACIIQMDNIFAIAGYRKYVNGMDLDNDNCTKIKKQKIVKIRVPREHLSHLHEYSNTTQWMALDIGVATVERPYNFQDITFRIHCSYIPAAIEINYNINLDKKIGTNVVALGWGRDRGSRTRDLVDRNSESLREVSIIIQKKDDCIKQFKGNGLSVMIDKYMICTHGKGLLDAEGYVIEEIDKTIYNICASAQSQTQQKAYLYPDQNDHGGPLITWVGSTELLIGVAVNSLYDVEYNCVGPYIFVSTSAAGQILKCLLSTDASSRKSCSKEALGGFDIYENVTKGLEVDVRATLRAQAKEVPTNKKRIPAIKSDYDDLSAIEVISI